MEEVIVLGFDGEEKERMEMMMLEVEIVGMKVVL